jgi:hypothetical protein
VQEETLKRVHPIPVNFSFFPSFALRFPFDSPPIALGFPIGLGRAVSLKTRVKVRQQKARSAPKRDDAICWQLSLMLSASGSDRIEGFSCPAPGPSSTV